ncbi:MULTISPECIES: hypothetical protein [Amycolatopsis]|uniref:hypothetical protein n=1 Tax=Amycolatopsis TaxID=1813 RepID=UPI00366CA416
MGRGHTRPDRLARRGDGSRHRPRARAYCNLADGFSWVGDLPAAHDQLRVGLDLATGAGVPFVVGTAEATRIRLDWAAGQWDGIDERADRLERAYPGLHPVVSELKLVKGWYAIAQGNRGEARRHLQEAGLGDTRNAISPVAIAAAGALVRMLLPGDTVDQARSYASRAVELLRAKQIWTWSGEVVPYAVDAYLRTGNVEDAEQGPRLGRPTENGIRQKEEAALEPARTKAARDQ